MANGLRLRFKLPAVVALAAALVLLVAPLVWADFSVQSWQFFQPVVLPADLAETSLVEVVPGREVFPHSARGLADLRILEVDSQREVPYVLLVERGEQRRSSVAVRMRDLGHVPGQQTTFILDLEREGILHNELEIITTSNNFQRDIVVEGSEDAENWRVLDDSGQIFDFTIAERGFTTRDTRVKYPSSTARYLRVRIVDEDQPPLEVGGAVVFFAQQLPPRETEISANITSRVEDVQGRETLLFLDLGISGFPANRITVTTSQENFYRQARLEGGEDNQTWTLLQDTEALYVFNTPKFQGRKLSLRYPESRFRYYRLTILNEDDHPLPVTGAQASGFLRKLIFFADPRVSYRLYYGSPNAEPPSYELEHAFPYLVTENLPAAGLGAHTANPLFTGPIEPTKPFTERYPWLLPTVVALAALLIGVFLTSLFRQLNGMLPPPPAPE